MEETKSPEVLKLEEDLRVSKLKNQIESEKRNTFKNSIISKSLIGIFGIVAFVVVTFVSLQIFTLYEIDKTLSPIFSLIAGGFTTYIIFVAGKILKEFTIKGGTVELSAKLQEEIKNVQNEVKETKKDVNDRYDKLIQHMDIRIDNVINNSNSNVNQVNLGDIVESLIKFVREEKIGKLSDAGINENIESIKQSDKLTANLKRHYNALNKQEEELRKILKKLPSKVRVMDDESSLIIEANYLSSQRKYHESLKKIDKVLAINPKNSSAKNIQGYIYEKLGNEEKALQCFDDALKLDPTNPTHHRNKGVLLRSFEKYDESLQCFDDALKINPEYAYGWLSKAVSLEKIKRYDDAKKCYEKVIEITNKDLSQIQKNYEKLGIRGYALWKLGKEKEALQCYDDALKINPEYDMVIYNLAVFHASNNNVEESLKYLKKAYQLNYTVKEKVRKESHFDNLRKDPEFQKLMS